MRCTPPCAIVGSVVASGHAVAGAADRGRRDPLGVPRRGGDRCSSGAGSPASGRPRTSSRARARTSRAPCSWWPPATPLASAPAFARTTRLLQRPMAVMLLAHDAILACCGLRIAGVEAQALTVVQFVPDRVADPAHPAALADSSSEPAAADRAGRGRGGRGAPPGRRARARALRRPGGVRRGQRARSRSECAVAAPQPQVAGSRDDRRDRRGPIGDGPVRYARRAGPLVPLRCHRDLVRLCGEIAEDDGEDGAYGARSELAREPGNAAAAIARGLPAIRVRCDGAGRPRGGIARARLRILCGAGAQARPRGGPVPQTG